MDDGRIALCASAGARASGRQLRVVELVCVIQINGREVVGTSQS
jgi:hypothetical protein